jgi:hypothetical protein
MAAGSINSVQQGATYIHSVVGQQRQAAAPSSTHQASELQPGVVYVPQQAHVNVLPGEMRVDAEHQHSIDFNDSSCCRGNSCSCTKPCSRELGLPQSRAVWELPCIPALRECKISPPLTTLLLCSHMRTITRAPVGVLSEMMVTGTQLESPNHVTSYPDMYHGHSHVTSFTIQRLATVPP